MPLFTVVRAGSLQLAGGLALLVLGCGEEPRVSLRGDDASITPVGPRCARAEDCDDLDPCTADLCVVGNVCDHERIGGCVSPRRCARAGDCDDGVACTRDRCLVSGVCDSVADDSLCAVGARCDAQRGCEGPDDAGGPSVDLPPAASDVFTPEDRPAAIDAPPPQDRPAAIDAPPPQDRPAVLDAPATGDAGQDPRSGRYTLVPALAYACQDEVFKTPVLSFAIAEITLSASSAEVTVGWPGGAVTLRGPAISSGTVRVTGAIPHPDCAATLTLTGSFPDPVRFSGSLALAFSGFGCALTNCEARSFTVVGTRVR
ncbi:MAG: hypothetical protein R3A48_09240 [Polyangiales bacterium]